MKWIGIQVLNSLLSHATLSHATWSHVALDPYLTGPCGTGLREILQIRHFHRSSDGRYLFIPVFLLVLCWLVGVKSREQRRLVAEVVYDSSWWLIKLSVQTRGGGGWPSGNGEGERKVDNKETGNCSQTGVEEERWDTSPPSSPTQKAGWQNTIH